LNTGATVQPEAVRGCLAGRLTSPLQVRTRAEADTVVVQVVRPLDVETSTDFGQWARSLVAAGRRLIVDLRRAEYIDSAGVRVLLALHTEMHRAAGELRLVVSPGSRVERTLRILRLHEHFHLYRNLCQAWDRRAHTA